MHKGRLEAFSDGVIAIIITIMVLELKVPHGETWSVLVELAPQLISYMISFVYVAIYWNNHHHLLQATKTVNGRVLWANMFWLFCLSLFPFASGWMGENHFSALPVSVFGFILLACALSWTVLHHELLKIQQHDSILHRAHQANGTKSFLSKVFYFLAIVTPFLNPWIGLIFSVIPAIMWLTPDRKIEAEIANH